MNEQSELAQAIRELREESRETRKAVNRLEGKVDRLGADVRTNRTLIRALLPDAVRREIEAQDEAQAH